MEAASVLLLSGGVESVTLLHQLTSAGEPLQAMFIDYGQRAAALERAAADVHCEPLGVELVPFDLSAVGAAFRNRQARKLHIPLPHRNLVALALAVSYATNQGARRVFLAANRDDATAYPSSSHPFLAQMRLMLGLLGDVQLMTPFIDMGKADIIRRGLRLGVDYETTYSCMLGHPLHCGRCPQCQRRRAAFDEAGNTEPDAFYRA